MCHITDDRQILDVFPAQCLPEVQSLTGRPKNRMSDDGAVEDVVDRFFETVKDLVFHLVPPKIESMHLGDRPRR